MNMTRKQFLKATAGLATAAAVTVGNTNAATMPRKTGGGPARSPNGKPGRGVSLYSYSGEWGVTMALEDCLADMYDMEAHGLEILANAHIDNYPNPGSAWLDHWFALLDRYEIVPVEYGHWVDSRLYPGRELNSKESFDSLVRDIKLANSLGFTVMRTKIGVSDETLTPVANWREFIEMALPAAEKYDVRMCPELHQPTALKSAMVDDYVDFIQKTGTKHFGLNIDFGVFQAQEARIRIPGMENKPSAPEDMVPLLPYTYACHAKFTHMTDELVEATHPYEAILRVMREQKWQGYMLSEYEGDNKDVIGHSSDQLRKQHVMMKRYLGEV